MDDPALRLVFKVEHVPDQLALQKVRKLRNFGTFSQLGGFGTLSQLGEFVPGIPVRGQS